jgi:endonuclease YncB( thermonuclease family)
MKSICLGLLAVMLATAAHAADPAATLTGIVSRVRDGDTIIVARVPIRLHAVAAPEIAHFGNPAEPGGDAAKAEMEAMALGRVATCELDGSQSHDRLVGRCFVDGIDVGAELIRRGLARHCPRYGLPEYAGIEPETAQALPLPAYCVPRTKRKS